MKFLALNLLSDPEFYCRYQIQICWDQVQSLRTFIQLGSVQMQVNEAQNPVFTNCDLLKTV